MKAQIQSSESNRVVQFARDGFLIFKSLVDLGECNLLSLGLTPLFEHQRKSANNKIGGVRNVLRCNPRISQFAKSPELVSVLEELAGAPVFPVRAIFFDKNLEANWLVPWHQDLTISVAGRIETPGFSGWSIKDGIPHVQPPRGILENMVTVRLHLDDCCADNGALRVIPGSHKRGKLNVTQIDQLTRTKAAVVCEVSKGGALLMRPLLLHSSSLAKNPSHRRVIHIEFASDELPNGLKWFERP